MTPESKKLLSQFACALSNETIYGEGDHASLKRCREYSDKTKAAREALEAYIEQIESASAAGAGSAQQGEQKDFEAWVRKDIGMPDRVPFNWETEWVKAALDGWQARAAIAQQAAPEAPATTASASIDTAEFRRLSFAYAEALFKGTVPQTSASWGALVEHVDSRTPSRAADGQQGASLPAQAPDPVVEANRKLLLDRSRVGVEKYGVTLAAAGLSREALLQHALEEALDLANYLQALLHAKGL